MAGELEGQVALITGGGRGIGRGIAIKYAEAGAKVAITSRSVNQLEETAELVRAVGGEVLVVPGDVSDPASVAEVCDATEKAFGTVTVVMNNAGVNGPYGPMWEVDADDWWHTQEIHLRGAHLFTHRLVPPMIARGGGRVINMVSGAGVRPNPNFSGYGVAKTAMIRMSETLALEGKEYGIIAFAMSPGLVITELAETAMRDAGAQRWRPEFVDRLQKEKSAGNYDASMKLVTDLAIKLAAGVADPISGYHFNPTDDVEALVARGQA